MALDPDHVRVDLLKVRRKLFISYPEGSKERQIFSTTAKIAELAYLQKLIAPEVVDFMFEEYAHYKRNEYLIIFISLMSGASLSSLLFGFHQMNPTSIWFSTFYVPFVFGAVFSLWHVFHLIEGYKKFKPFQTECDNIRQKIKKIADEMKRIE